MTGHLVHPLARHLRQPIPIRPLRSSHVVRRQAGFRIAETLPFFDFRMAVRKTQTARLIVISGREIHPPDSHTRRCARMPKAGVIDALIMFVDEYPSLGRVHEITIFSKGAEWSSRMVTVIAIQPRPIRWNSRDSAVGAWVAEKTWAYCANSLIHREAANSWQPLSTNRDRSRISRALIQLYICACVAGQDIVLRLSQQSRIGRVWQGFRVAYYPDVSGGGAGLVFIWRQKIIKIPGIDSPGNHHLLAVVHAHDALGLGFGLGECR